MEVYYIEKFLYFSESEKRRILHVWQSGYSGSLEIKDRVGETDPERNITLQMTV